MNEIDKFLCSLHLDAIMSIFAQLKERIEIEEFDFFFVRLVWKKKNKREIVTKEEKKNAVHR